jgi:hypothetical protein
MTRAPFVSREQDRDRSTGAGVCSTVLLLVLVQLLLQLKRTSISSYCHMPCVKFWLLVILGSMGEYR